MYVCLECLTEYEGLYRTIFDGSVQAQHLKEMPCLMRDCPGDVVQLDEFIAPAIMMLNEKGYSTRFCCAGHVTASENPDSFYVFFYDFVEFEEEELAKLPKSFTLENDGRGLTIRYRTSKKIDTVLQKMEEVVKCNKLFYQWVENLPEASEY